jgi:1-acyl-sn-glycerol-3-phosphate acyltransferase
VRSDDWLYRAGWVLVRGLARWFFRLEIHGESNVPLTGALVMTANHLSMLDPPLIGCACPRELRYMAKAELFRYPILGRLFRRLGGFPVERGTADVSAIRTALHHLREGRAVLLFIEGTRGTGEYLLPPTPGATLLARQSGAPVLPTAIIGTERAMPRGAKLPRPVQVKIAFGKPITYAELFGSRTDREARDAFTDYLMEQIAALLRKLGHPLPRKEQLMRSTMLSHPAKMADS